MDIHFHDHFELGLNFYKPQWTIEEKRWFCPSFHWQWVYMLPMVLWTTRNGMGKTTSFYFDLIVWLTHISFSTMRTLTVLLVSFHKEKLEIKNWRKGISQTCGRISPLQGNPIFFFSALVLSFSSIVHFEIKTIWNPKCTQWISISTIILS